MSVDSPQFEYGAAVPPMRGGSLGAVLLRRAWIIVLTTVLVAVAAGAFAYFVRNTYTSSTELLFDQNVGNQLNALGLIPPYNNPDRLAGDSVALVSSRATAALAAQRLGHGYTENSAHDDVTVTGTKTDDVVTVTATGSSARRAANLASAFASAAVYLEQQSESRRARAVMTDLQAQLLSLPANLRNGFSGQQIALRIAQLHALMVTGSGNPRVIQPANLPTAKSGKLGQTIGLGALFGALLGLALALLRERVDRKLRDAGDVAAAFNAPILAAIPRHRSLKRQTPFTELPQQVADAFFMLQSKLHYGRTSRGPRSLIVTSSRQGEGKTTVATYLAAAHAAAGFNVALVDADLRSSKLALDFKLRSFPGLSEILRDNLPAEQALQPLPLSGGRTLGAGSGRVDVLVAGGRPQDPAAQIQSPSMVRVLDELMTAYDFVIVDTPPISQVADAIPLLRRVEGVLVVASVHTTRGVEAEQLRSELQALDAPLLGVVANAAGASSGYARATTTPVYAS